MATAARPEMPTDGFVSDRALGVGALVMLAATSLAVIRGHADWGRISWHVWAHLATIAVVLALTPVMLFAAKGSAAHRVLGWVWASAMAASAMLSFLIRDANHGSLGVIHILSAYVLVQVPRLVWQARTHRVAAHRRSVRGLVVGGLLIAGFFTLPFDRLLGHWLFA